MREERYEANTIESNILGKHFNVLIDVAINSISHICQHLFVDLQNQLMDLGRQSWIQTLAESFRECDFINDVWRWILSDDNFDVLQPVVNVSPCCIVREVGHGLLQMFIQVVGDCRYLSCLLHQKDGNKIDLNYKNVHSGK